MNPSRRRFTARLICGLACLPFVGIAAKRRSRQPEDDLVMVNGWILKRSDVKG